MSSAAAFRPRIPLPLCLSSPRRRRHQLGDACEAGGDATLEHELYRCARGLLTLHPALLLDRPDERLVELERHGLPEEATGGHPRLPTLRTNTLEQLTESEPRVERWTDALYPKSAKTRITF